MINSRNRLDRVAALVAVVLAGAAVQPAGARAAADGPIPCSAFQRNAYGGWRVLAPVTMDIGGSLYSPIVGTTFVAGASQGGVHMSDLLDQQCGNR